MWVPGYSHYFAPWKSSPKIESFFFLCHLIWSAKRSDTNFNLCDLLWKRCLHFNSLLIWVWWCSKRELLQDPNFYCINISSAFHRKTPEIIRNVFVFSFLHTILLLLVVTCYFRWRLKWLKMAVFGRFSKMVKNRCFLALFLDPQKWHFFVYFIIFLINFYKNNFYFL